jgi:micrococcal nuclease
VTRTLATLVLALAASAAPAHADRTRYSRRQAQRSLTQAEQPGLVIGELALTAVVDGDTIKVAGLDSSLRLIGIDTEETFKREADRRGADAGLDEYRSAKRGESARPVKMATPMGEAAKAFAKRFFDGVDRVKLERDHPAEIRDRYGRYLAYVLVERGGRWLNYNVECVRAGMAPYFPKYGNSRRFHAAFVAAEAEARRAQRGIWAPGAPGYTDYAEREAWWQARAAFIDAFRKEAEGQPDHIDLTHWDALAQLEARAGTPVVVLGIVGDVRPSERGPSKVTLSRRLGSDFPLIFFDRAVLAASGIATWKGEPVVVTGVPTVYEHPRTHDRQLQIVIDRASQVRLSPVPGLTPPAPPAP